MANKEKVLIPYEITLLSNTQITNLITTFVLIPYEITLLSNNGQIGVVRVQF